jgi:hypothetical protein
VRDKWRIDELYEGTVVFAADALAETSAAVDEGIVDAGIAKLPPLIASVLGSVLRAFQTGVVHVYAAFMVIGLGGFGWYFLVPHPAGVVTQERGDRGDYVVTAGPGIGYTYRWDTDGTGLHAVNGDPTTAKVHLEEGTARNVVIETTSAFGISRQVTIRLYRETTVKPMQLGQN